MSLVTLSGRTAFFSEFSLYTWCRVHYAQDVQRGGLALPFTPKPSLEDALVYFFTGRQPQFQEFFITSRGFLPSASMIHTLFLLSSTFR